MLFGVCPPSSDLEQWKRWAVGFNMSVGVSAIAKINHPALNRLLTNFLVSGQ